MTMQCSYNITQSQHRSKAQPRTDINVTDLYQAIASYFVKNAKKGLEKLWYRS